MLRAFLKQLYIARGISQFPRAGSPTIWSDLAGEPTGGRLSWILGPGGSSAASTSRSSRVSPVSPWPRWTSFSSPATTSRAPPRRARPRRARPRRARRGRPHPGAQLGRGDEAQLEELLDAGSSAAEASRSSAPHRAAGTALRQVEGGDLNPNGVTRLPFSAGIPGLRVLRGQGKGRVLSSGSRRLPEASQPPQHASGLLISCNNPLASYAFAQMQGQGARFGSW